MREPLSRKVLKELNLTPPEAEDLHKHDACIICGLYTIVQINKGEWTCSENCRKALAEIVERTKK